MRYDEIAHHVGAARTHAKMVGTFGIIMMGTVAGAEDHYAAIFEGRQPVGHAGRTLLIGKRLVPGQEIEARFFLAVLHRGTIKEPVEKFGQRLGSTRAKEEDPVGKVLVMKDLCLLYRGYVFYVTAQMGRDRSYLGAIRHSLVALRLGDLSQQPVGLPLKGHQRPRAGLEMHMVRGRSSA